MKMYEAGIIIIVTVLVTVFAFGLITNHLHPQYYESEHELEITPTPPDKR